MAVHPTMDLWPTGSVAVDAGWSADRNEFLTVEVTGAGLACAGAAEQSPSRSPRPGAAPGIIASSGSIGAAARVHGITQQAASARLRNFEGLCGLTLLDRQARGSRLTEAGTAAAAWAERVVAAAAETDGAVAALRHDGHARLRVAASMTIAEHLVPRWLVALRTRFPAGDPCTDGDADRHQQWNRRPARARRGTPTSGSSRARTSRTVSTTSASDTTN